MGDLHLRLSEAEADQAPVNHPPIGRLLLESGKIAEEDLSHALSLQNRIDAPLGDILIAEGLIEKRDVLSALEKQARARGVDLGQTPPALGMATQIPSDLCLKHGAVPLLADGTKLHIAVSNPTDFNNLQRTLGLESRELIPVIAEEHQIRAQQCRLYGNELAHKAETRVAAAESCRNWGLSGVKRHSIAAIVAGTVLICLVLAPMWTLTLATLWAVVTLVMTTALKAAALITHFNPKMPPQMVEHLVALKRLLPRPKGEIALPELSLLPTSRADAALRIAGALQSFPGGIPIINASESRFRLPRVSVLVPLLHEREIATQLIDRLSRLTYPKSLLEVVLVLEESDTVTRETIARTHLPDWMNVIEVPQVGDLTTKPRALNYALDFCRGSIIGVWDAEDWPEADQIEKVVSRFHEAPNNVVCLQGVLDYYNSRTNWLSRCFTIEYAMWWRIIMPGIARMGLVVPLGGTTLFFKRTILEELGGWDAHNVTEDADLGVRLARHGYVTELLPTVTREEATSRAWPWVRQRSRWLKGFLVTYLVHMREPRALLRDVGLWRFMGLQTLFLASVSQFAAAPLLWSFWLTLFGMTHPVSVTLGSSVMWGLAGFFIAAELLNILIGVIAVSRPGHRYLVPFVPTMMVYFGLGALAAYKAVWELIRMPFFWDKTQHGISGSTDPAPSKPALQASS